MCVVIGMHHRPNARCAQGYFRSSNERSAHATGIDDAIDDEPHALARRTVAGFVHDAGVAAELEHAVDTNAARIVGETLRTAGYTEAAITAALGDDAHVAEQKARYAARRATLRAAVEGFGLRVDHSDAGLYLWATRGEDAWATIDALAARGILAAPGSFYGEAGREHVRIALTATDERIAAAAERLAE
jgi:hypothetical protein